MANHPVAPLSGAETEVLRLLWHLATGTVQDVCDALPTHRRIAYATVQTLLRRLEAKGYVTHQTRGRAHVFVPAIDQEKVIERSIGDFVQRLFGGDPVPLMLHLADQRGLSDDDLKRLRELVDPDSTDRSEGR